MKVVMLGNYPTENISGGVAVHTINLINSIGEIDDENFDFHMISFGNKSTTFNKGNVKITLMKVYRIYYLIPIFAIFKLAWVVRKVRPDIIHIQGSNISPYLIYTLFFNSRKIKKVITLHSYPTRELIAHGKLDPHSLRFVLLKWLEKKSAYKSDLLIAVDTRLKDWIIEEFGEDTAEKVIVMLNGVDLNLFKPIKTSDVRSAFGLSLEDFIIFHAKAFVAKNGQKYLINAMPEVIQKIPNAKLILAGDGPMKDELVALVKKLKVVEHVVFVGNLPNNSIPNYIGASDIICIPSTHVEGLEEASSIFLVEAMAMGKPCIATNIGGLAESINSEENGILVPDKNSNAIANAIIELYNNPELAYKIGKNGRIYVEKERTWNTITKKMIELYSTLLSAN